MPINFPFRTQAFPVQPTYTQKHYSNQGTAQNSYKSHEKLLANNIESTNSDNSNIESSSLDSDSNNSNNNTSNKKNHPNTEECLEIFGLKLYFDDILIICILFFLYTEGVQDEKLFICLILLLLS